MNNVFGDSIALFNANKDNLNWNLPFPMGVFGTLKKNGWNAPRMGVFKDSGDTLKGNYVRENWKSINYLHHCKAFLPHFAVGGIWLSHAQNNVAPFEIYFYDDKNWNLMIPDVESLEGFKPGRFASGYHRTLAWLYLMDKDEAYPKDLKEAYPKDCKDAISYHDRLRVPAWIYCNMEANESSLKAGDSPIIWTGKVDK